MEIKEQKKESKDVIKLSLSQILSVKVYISPWKQKLIDIVNAYGLKEQ